jgi:hypothetical protein
MAASESPYRDAFTDPSGGSVSLILMVWHFVQFWTKCNIFFLLFLLLLVFSLVVKLSELPEINIVSSFGICRVFLVFVDLRDLVGGTEYFFGFFECFGLWSPPFFFKFFFGLIVFKAGAKTYNYSLQAIQSIFSPSWLLGPC